MNCIESLLHPRKFRWSYVNYSISDDASFGNFDTLWQTVVVSWDFMLGNTDIGGWAESYYEFFGILIFFVFTFMVVILMLNLVIAIMGDEYDKVIS